MQTVSIGALLSQWKNRESGAIPEQYLLLYIPLRFDRSYMFAFSQSLAFSWEGLANGMSQKTCRLHWWI